MLRTRLEYPSVSTGLDQSQTSLADSALEEQVQPPERAFQPFQVDQDQTDTVRLSPLPPLHYPIEKSSEHHDGGVRGWVCIAGSFLAMFCSFGFLNA